MSNATAAKNGLKKNPTVVATEPRNEVLDALQAIEGNPDAVVSGVMPEKTLTARERCLQAAKFFAANGRQPLMNEPADQVGAIKFRGAAQPRKNWHADALVGKKISDLTIDVVAEAATCDILDTQQGSVAIMQKGTVSVGINARRNVILGKEATEALAGEFYQQCNRE